MNNRARLNILLVGDGASRLAGLDIGVEEHGANLIFARPAQEVLACVATTDFAAIVIGLDAQAMDALEIARLIRSQPRSTLTPIIFVDSPGAPEFPIDLAYELGAVDYLPAPVHPRVLRARLSFLIELARKNDDIAVLKQTMQAERPIPTREKDAQFDLILKNIKDYALIVTNVDGRITQWEGGAEAITGWPANEVVGQLAAIIFTPEDRAARQPEAEMAIAGNTGRAQDRRWHLRKDGSRFFADGVLVPLKEPNGFHRGFFKLFRDATAEQRTSDEIQATKASLQESRELFSLLLESAADGIYGMDAVGRCTFINAAGAQMLGYRPEELVGRRLHDVIHHRAADGSCHSAVECPIDKAARGGLASRIDDEVFWRKDGRPFPVSYSVSPMMTNGVHAGAVITFTDITERRQAEAERLQLLKEVQAARDRIIDVFKQAPAFMCVLMGPTHVFELTNERYLQLVGNRDLIGQPVRQALPEVTRQGFFKLLDRVYQTGESFSGTGMPVLLQRVPGGPLEERFIDLVYTALRDANGTITGILVHGIDQTHRKLAEIAQRENQERLRLATEAAELGLWSWSPSDTTITWENDRINQILGLAPSDMPLDAVRFTGAFIHPDDIAAFRQAVTATLDRGVRFQFEGRVRRTDGEIRWIESYGRRQDPTDNAPPRLIGTISDITSRKLAEAERYESRERFQKIVSQAATGVVQTDAKGNIILVNQKFCALLGYAEAELLGANVVDLTAPASRQETIEAVGTLVAGSSGFVIEKQYRRKDGSLMWANSSVNALRSATGMYQGLVAIVVDVTESRQAAQALQASEERYRTLFESVDQGFCVIDMIFDAAGAPVDYQFLEMNPVFEKHTGLANAAGRNVKELVPDLDHFWIDTYGRVALTGEAIRFENEAKAMGRWFDVYATRIGGRDSRKVALLFSDITARKRSDDNLRQLALDLSEADRRKTEFLATLAHELRNPLAPIRSGLSVMRLSAGNPVTMAKIRDMMDRQISQMVHLIDDLLDIARISGGKMDLKKGRHALKSILAGAVETSLPLIEAAQHRLVVEMPEESLTLDADPVRIGQIISNLLNNAAKYTPPRGRISLTAHQDGDEAVISVTDSGIGIPEESLSAVFDMFNQVGRNMHRAQGGLGIGLSLVRRLVEMHGGTVSAVSAGAGKGSTFTVRLPIAGHRAEASASPVRQLLDGTKTGTGTDGKKLKVLVVDDNIDAAETMAALLDFNGYVVRVANDGLEGVEAARQFEPDVALLDIGMPGMNGYETARALHNIPGLDRVVLVALTGWGAGSDRAMSKKAGFSYHLTKPAELETIDALLSNIASVLAQPPSTQHVDHVKQAGN